MRALSVSALATINKGPLHAGFLKTTCLTKTSTLFPGLPLPLKLNRMHGKG